MIDRQQLQHLVLIADTGEICQFTAIEAIEQRRKYLRLTKEEMAEVLAIGPSHYSDLQSGRRKVNINIAKRAYAIGVSSKELLQP